VANQEGINGFVLAGGKSSRMGQDKALMTIAGKPLVLRATEILQPFVRMVSLLAPAGRYEDLGFPVVADLWPGQGPLAAVCTGLLCSSTEWNIFLACDLPLITRKFVQVLVERIRASRADAIVPRSAEGWQPLSAAYHSRCQTSFSRAIQDGERSIVSLLDNLRVEEITRDEMVSAGIGDGELANMNTPEDWAHFREPAKGGR
jgi:molybdopterin-guanine dinucleotide biosynthesis protein A